MRNKQDCPPPPPPEKPCRCDEMDTPTQQSINLIRAAWCSLLYQARGTASQQEEKFNGEEKIFNEKKCMFVRTEQNYRRYRNLEITVGTELIQTNDLTKASITKLKDWNKNLNSTLVTLTKQIKDAKSKFSDLNTAACNLKRAYNEKCNAAQRRALTVVTSENCEEQPKPAGDPCKEAAGQIDDLICLPGGLAYDIDSIWQSAADVVGIQLFSNVDTLEPLQKDLSEKSLKFEKQINDTMKLRKTELDKLQDELVTSVKSITQAAVSRNNARAEFEGYYDAVDYLCCPDCDCIPKENSDNPNQQDDCNECPPRLGECEERICKICGEVKATFCCPEISASTSQTAV